MNKKITVISIISVVLLALGILASTAGSRFKMDYLPGANDGTVTGLPETAYGNVDTAFTVASETPSRDGYHFISWKLNYGGGVPYTVLFKEYNGGPTDTELRDPIVQDSFVGDVIPLTAENITSYELYGVQPYGESISTSATTANLEITDNPDHNVVTFWYTLKPVTYTVYFKDSKTLEPLYYRDYAGNWVDYMVGVGYPGQTVTVEAKVFTNYGLEHMEHLDTNLSTFNFSARITLSENPDENIVDCYYNKTATLTIRYIDIDTGDMLIEDEKMFDLEVGSILTVNAKDIPPYISINQEISVEIQEGDNMIVFIYYYFNDYIC